MCDCFHVVLPTWPGAPGSGSGRQLQPEDASTEAEEDHPVTAGTVDEIIRPRPQGSSPVYECVAEGAGFGFAEDTPSRHTSSGRRRSWWKRDAGDSRTFSRMSQPESTQEATGVTLKTEVETGASGYSVTGGGDQGIFVKQVLKGSTAAKLFSLREGDQLLSTTIFFDDIKYEDALKILQYSEPYKVQFQIKRKLPAREDQEWASSDPKDNEKQDKAAADGDPETPSMVLEGDGDQERLISKPREGRGRQPKDERLSWPKFQAIKPKRGPGPRRSHSSSEACERGGAPDVSPPNTDPEAQLPAEEQEVKAGPDNQPRRWFLNLRFRAGPGKGLVPVGRPGREAPGGLPEDGVLEEAGAWDDAQEDPRTVHREDRMPEAQDGAAALSKQWRTEPNRPSEDSLGEGAEVVPRRPRKTKEVKVQEETEAQGKPRAVPAPGQDRQAHGQGELDLETGSARPSLQDTVDMVSTQSHPPEFQVRIPTLKTPKFGFSKEKVPDTEGGMMALQLEQRKGQPSRKDMVREQADGGADQQGGQRAAPEPPRGKEAVQGDTTRNGEEDDKAGESDTERWEGRMKMLRFKMPSFGWPPGKEPRAPAVRVVQGVEKEEESPVLQMAMHTDESSRPTGGGDTEVQEPGQTLREEGQSDRKERHTTQEDEADAKDSKFKMPKFKMPSFGVSAPSKSTEASVDVTLPKAQAEVCLPSIQADIKTSDLPIELPSAELDDKTAEVGLTLPEGQVPGAELQEAETGAGHTGHLPKVQMPSIKMPSIKMPKVDLKGPRVDIKGPKLDLKGEKGDTATPDVEVAVPSVEVDIQAPGAKLEGDLSLGDKEVSARDRKFKMPKFKMPSFSVSAPRKDLETSVDMPVPKVTVEATRPSLGGEIQAPEGSVQLPSADAHLPGAELEVALPGAVVMVSDLKDKAEGARIKGHLPKVQMPSIKMPKVDIKGPSMDIKGPSGVIQGPSVDVKGPSMDVRGEVAVHSPQVDIQVPGANLEVDLSLAGKKVPTRDSKFRMPKFKMPSFGVSAPSKSTEASVDVTLPKAQAEVCLPSIQADIKTSDLPIELPSADLDLKTAEVGLKLPEGRVPGAELQEAEAGAGLTGHLPKLQMPSIKMPKVDMKGPRVDIKGPKLDLKGEKGDTATPDVEVAVPSVKVDIQAPGAKLEGDLSVGDKEMSARDSKFKMPKFKMPSFGVSAPSKDLETSVDVPVPKVTVEATRPSLGGEIQAPEGSVQLPSADAHLPGAELEVAIPGAEAKVSQMKGKAEGAQIKGHLPKEQMPGIKMPKVDIKGPSMDIKCSSMDIRGPSMDVRGEVALLSPQVDIQVPMGKLEGDLSLAGKEVAPRDSKFKMPKFKIPSFGVSAPSKDLETSVDVPVPKVAVEATRPSLGGEIQAPEGRVQRPSADAHLPVAELEVALPGAEATVSELKGKAEGMQIKGHLPKVLMPSIKMPKIDIKGPSVDIKGSSVDIKGPSMDVRGEVAVPSLEVDIPVPGAKLEGDLSLAGEVSTRDSKFKMSKFKMPSFGVSAPSKSTEASVDVTLPKAQAEVCLPSIQADIKTSDLPIELPSADLDVKMDEVGLKLPEGQVPGAELQEAEAGAGLTGHLPKVQMPSIKMPSIKMPKVDLKGPRVDIKGPKLDLKGEKGETATPDVEVAVPSVEVDIQSPGAKLEGDLSLGDKEVSARDRQFKIPKFKMPSFGVSAPSKDLETSVDVSVPKVTVEATRPSLGGEIQAPEGSIQLPSADAHLPGGELEVALPGAEATVSELKGKAEGARIKGHLPKVQMPSIKMPKVEIQGPSMDVKGPSIDVKGKKGEVASPDVEVALLRVKVDIQEPCAKLQGDPSLGDKEVSSRDSKFKMPKFKMPSFGMSAPCKDLETSVDVPVPKVAVEATRPSLGGEIQAPEGSVQLPSADAHLPGAELEVAIPGAEATLSELKGKAEGARIKGHLPKVQMPGIKMPTVDIKGPSVDIKGSTVEIKSPSMDVRGEVAVPSPQVDIQVPGANLEGDLSLAGKDVPTRDSKFRMPKFKMPSFGVSAPSKSTEASVDGSLPKAQAELCLPSIQADVKTSDLPIELPSANLDVKTAEVGLTLPEVQVPGAELQEAEAGARLTGHLPKVQMPSIKMPKVDLKGPRVDINGPKLDLKGGKGDMATPDVEVAVPSVEVDIQVPGAKLEGDLSVGDEVSARDSKFKMPKFKMPSFGVSAPRKDLETSVDVPLPKVTVEATRPSLGGEIQAPEGSVQQPSADAHLPGAELEVALPEAEVMVSYLKDKAEGARIKGHLSKVQMSGIKMPKVDIKGPSVDIIGSSVDIKGPSMDVRGEVAVPSLEVDIPVPGAKLEGDLSLAGEVSSRDSKFKMPKFKMPSFGVSAPSKDLETSVDVPVPKVAVEATRPSLGGEIQAPEGSVQLPSADAHLPGAELEVALPGAEATVSELKGKAEGARIKGRLPKLQMPGIKMPKVDIQGPSMDVKGPSIEVKGKKGEVASPDVEVALPRVKVDIQAPGAKLARDLSLGDKDVSPRDSKFKMPKFKMPSFGMSAPSKSMEASVGASHPKTQAEVCLPSIQADIKTSDLPIELPSADLEVKMAEVGLKLPESQVPGEELQEAEAGAGLQGQLPKLQMPSIKMPKVDLKGPRVDIKGPSLDLKGVKGEAATTVVEVAVPMVEVDIQVPGAKLKGDLSVGDKEVSARDSKFKMPKFKMPSFGMSAPSKDLETSVDVPVPKVAVEATWPSLGGEIQAPEGSIQLPSADVHLPGAELEVALPGAEATVSELKAKAEGTQIKGHLPKVQMPSIKMPKVDIKGPSMDIKGPSGVIQGPSVDVKGPSMDVRGEVALHSPQVDIQVPGAKLEGDLSLAGKEVPTRESRFKMPKFKMPSFGVSAPSKSTEASVYVTLPKAQAEVCLPSIQADIKTSDLPIELPSADLDLKTAEVGLKLPEGQVPGAELQEAEAGAGLTGHLPKVQMPSIKMPKVDLKGPWVDIKGPKLGLKGEKGDTATPDVEVAVPSVEVDIQSPGAKLEGDLSLGDKEVSARDRKFKMPKFKMPSFSVSAPRKDLETSVDMPVPKVTVEATRPSLGGEIQAPEGSVQLPSADAHLPGAELEVALPGAEVTESELKGIADRAQIKGHLPKVQMPSIKMPKVDIQGPSMDVKGPSIEVKGKKGEVASPDVEVALPRVKVDIQEPCAKLEGDPSLGDKEVSSRDSKFKMPKFKMPSFGMSAPCKDLETSVDVPVPKVAVEATRPSLGGEIQAPEGSVQLPSADAHLPGAELEVAIPGAEATVSELKGKVEGAWIKGHLPKVQVPSIKMPKVDIKGPSVDIKGPSIDMRGEVAVPNLEVDIQVPGAKLECDLSLAGKEAPTRDSKFKMPKFKMPSFGVSAPSKSTEASVDGSLPKAQAEVCLPSIQADIKTSDLPIELPSADLDVKTAEVGVTLPECRVPGAELQEAEAGAGLTGHLPKVQMPSIKMPKVDTKGPSVAVHIIEGDIASPDIQVSLPSPEAGTCAPLTTSPVNQDSSAKHSDFTASRVSVPFSVRSSTTVSLGLPQVQGALPCNEVTSSLCSVDSGVCGVDHISPVDFDGGQSVASGGQSSSWKSHFEISKVFSPPGKAPEGSVALGVSAPASGGGGSLVRFEAAPETTLHLRGLAWPGRPAGRLDLSGPHTESSTRTPHEGILLAEYQVAVPRAAVSLEVPRESPSVSREDAPWPSLQGAPVAPACTSILLSQVDSWPGPAGSPFPASCGRVTFPKFHQPRFVFSVPRAGAAEVQPTSAECAPALSPPSPVRPPDCSAEEATVFPLPPTGVSVSKGTEGLLGAVGTSAMASEATPAADADCEGKGSSLKMPRLKLPSFRWSPKKGAGSREDPVGSLGVAEISLVVDTVPSGVPAGVHAAQMDAPPDVSPEQDGEKGVVCAPGFAGLQLALPSTGAPRRGAGLLHTDPDPSLSSPPGRTESPAAGTSSSEGGGDTGAVTVPSDTAGVNLQLPRVRVPRLGLATPTLGPCEDKVEGSLSAGNLPLPEHGLSLGDGSTGHWFGDGSAPSAEDPLPPSCRAADGEGPAEGSLEWAVPTGSQESWLRMPVLRLPSAWHSSEERGCAGSPRGLLRAPAASSPGEGVRSQGIRIPGPEVTASLQSPEAGVDVAAVESTSHTDVLRQNLHSRSLKLHLPPARVSASDLGTSEAGVCPGEGSLPLQVPQRRLPETYHLSREAGRTALPGPAGQDLARGQKGAGEWSSHPEGPLKLKVSTTDMPSQISVVNMGQLWEDSVLTVRFPKLKVPRLTFPVPSSEADIFIPTVREIQCPESSLDIALQRERPGVWDASILKAGARVPREQPAVLDLSSEASPVSKVRVHIQGARADSQEVTTCSRVAAEPADVADPPAFPTQAVRESEIPASEMQTPAYGFSLFKVKIPEPPTQAGVQVVTPDSRLRWALQEAPEHATPGADPVSGDLQCNTGEPFEMISSSVMVPGLQTCAFEVRPGHQFADSCSDEEPAEILEFPPEDSQEAAPAEEDGVPKTKPKSKGSSGIFRFWLPNMGFSSSVEEKIAESKDKPQRPVTVQAQPEARPEAGLPHRQEKVGSFRFPKLGFSSPTKKSTHAEDEARLAELKPQEEAATFFDAQDSFPIEEDEGERTEAAGVTPAPEQC